MQQWLRERACILGYTDIAFHILDKPVLRLWTNRNTEYSSQIQKKFWDIQQ